MILTGLKKLDKFLSGGIPNGVLVDIFGEHGTGKTQLLLQLSINSIKKGGNVLYLDTTGTFRPERILQIQQQLGINFDFLQHITVSRITNTSEQIKSLKNIQEKNFSLIVIDNISDLFSYEYQKKESTYQKNLIFMNYMHDLSNFAICNRIPIVVTNMIRNIDSTEMENMKSAISFFTHIKIQLFKDQSKLKGKVNWALKSESFSYKIDQVGLFDSTEDI